MNRVATAVLALVFLLPGLSSAGWRDVLEGAERVDKLIGSRPAPAPSPEPSEQSDDAPPPPPRSEAPKAAPRSGADAHFIAPDDYFINSEPLGEHTYIYVKLAKMVSAPSANTKDEGEFMKVQDGQNMWTGFIWKSRIADKSELKLGMHVIMFHDNNSKGVYQAPQKKDKARNGTWWYAKITDMSDMYKGYVTVSGGYKVGLGNMRVPLPYGAAGDGEGGGQVR